MIATPARRSAVVLLLLLAAAPALAQPQPSITHDTTPVVMHGPRSSFSKVVC